MNSGSTKNLLEKKGHTQSFSKTSRGYFEAPNLIFDLPISSNEKIILLNLIRRADKIGRSFPSQCRICKDCGIKSRKTVRTALKQLEKTGLIKKHPPTKHTSSNTYELTQEIFLIIQDAKEEYKKKKKKEGKQTIGNIYPPPGEEIPTKENTNKENTSFNEEELRINIANGSLVDPKRNYDLGKDKERCGQFFNQVSANGEIHNIGPTRLLKKLTLNENQNKDLKPLFDSQLTPEEQKKADLLLLKIEMNNRKEFGESFYEK